MSSLALPCPRIDYIKASLRVLVEELVRRGKHQNCNRYDLNLYSGAFENIIQQVEKYPDISGSRQVVLKD